MADPTMFAVLHHAQSLPEGKRAEFQFAYQAQAKDRFVALLLSLFLGYLGIDRLYLGQVGLGLLKLFTVGGCGFWIIIDWFVIMSATDRHNRKVARRLRHIYSDKNQNHKQSQDQDQDQDHVDIP